MRGKVDDLGGWEVPLEYIIWNSKVSIQKEYGGLNRHVHSDHDAKWWW